MGQVFRAIAQRVRRFGGLAGLIVCLSLAPGATFAADPDQDAAGEISSSSVKATVNGGRLTLEAEEVPLADVLRAIGEAGSFGVVLRGKLAEPVNRSFTDESLEEAIRKLVGSHSLVVIRDDSIPGEPATGLAEIRVTANRTQMSLERAEAGLEKQEAYRRAVLTYRPPTKDDLIFALDEPDAAARVAAVPKVGSLLPREAVEVIAHVLVNDDDATVRSRAIGALTRLEGPGARGVLRARALGDDDPGLRIQALNALASSRGERAVNVVGQALRQDTEPRVRMSAVRALGRIGGEWARRSLERATRDWDPEISVAAEEALAAWPHE